MNPVQTARKVPSLEGSNAILRSALKYGGIVAAVLAVVGGALSWALGGPLAALSAGIGVAFALVFLSLTALSILIANRFRTSEVYMGIFFAVVLGMWLVKFVLFIVVAVVMRNLDWVNTLSLFLSLLAGVIGMLVVDVVALMNSRSPVVDERVLDELGT